MLPYLQYNAVAWLLGPGSKWSSGLDLLKLRGEGMWVRGGISSICKYRWTPHTHLALCMHTHRVINIASFLLSSQKLEWMVTGNKTKYPERDLKLHWTLCKGKVADDNWNLMWYHIQYAFYLFLCTFVMLCLSSLATSRLQEEEQLEIFLVWYTI